MTKYKIIDPFTNIDPAELPTVEEEAELRNQSSNQESDRIINNVQEINMGSGDQSFHLGEEGMWFGADDFSSAPFSVDMDGTVTGAGGGGTECIYGKTSLTDTTNAGYYIKDGNVYFGNAGDTRSVKYDLTADTLAIKGAEIGLEEFDILDGSGNTVGTINTNIGDTALVIATASNEDITIDAGTGILRLDCSEIRPIGAPNLGSALSSFSNVYATRLYLGTSTYIAGGGSFSFSQSISVSGVIEASSLVIGTTIRATGDYINIDDAKTPSSASDTGSQGDICWDSDYVYVCVADNTWKRASLSTW